MVILPQKPADPSALWSSNNLQNSSQMELSQAELSSFLEVALNQETSEQSLLLGPSVLQNSTPGLDLIEDGQSYNSGRNFDNFLRRSLKRDSFVNKRNHKGLPIGI